MGSYIKPEVSPPAPVELKVSLKQHTWQLLFLPALPSSQEQAPSLLPMVAGVVGLGEVEVEGQEQEAEVVVEVVGEVEVLVT